MKRRAPVVATWLLEQFGVSERNEPFIGDLFEEYSAGRSAWWFGGRRQPPSRSW
jgi:hypothetical protein